MRSNDFGGEIIGVLKHGVRNRVRVIVGRNRSARRKPPTCCKSLTNFIT